MDTVIKSDSSLSNDEQKRILFDALTTRKLELTLLPTEKCNFRCVYCYEKFERGNIDSKLSNSIKKYLSKKIVELDYLILNWFGGEPLLNKPALLELSHFTKKLCEEHNVKYHFGITTNGSLLDEKFFIELNNAGIQQYQISIDGSKEEHDKTRITTQKKGSFDTIWKNLLLANELFLDGKISNTKILLRLHLHARNIKSQVQFAKMVKDNLSPKLFQIFTKEVGNYDGKKNGLELIEHDSRVFADYKSIIQQELSDYRSLNISKEQYVCYAAKGNAYVIRSDGAICKCTVGLDDNKNIIGHLNDEGNMEINNDKAIKWLYPLSTMDSQDLGCPYSNLPKN